MPVSDSLPCLGPGGSVQRGVTIANRGLRIEDRVSRFESRNRKEGVGMQRADFRQFYREAHDVTCLTDREKMLLGLAVAMTRNCEP